MLASHPNSTNRHLNRTLLVREAVLLAFCDPLPSDCERLLGLSPKEWHSLLRWLDTAGLALYFLDRLEELGLIESVPPQVLARLRQNLADNTERIGSLITESATIQHRFQSAGLSYCVVKGFSLWPLSVPKIELRSQLDLDFLVSEESSTEAQRILEELGFRVIRIIGRTMELRAGEERTSNPGDLYRAGLSRTVELHTEQVRPGRPSRLAHARNLSFHGISMPVLRPTDLFLGQGMHLYKNLLCSQFSRVAHLMEFRHHVIARRGDEGFWKELEQQVREDRAACVGLGAATLLIARVMGPFAPEAFTRWTVDQLPATAGLWADLFAHRTVLASFPGSKLYTLLQKELQTTTASSTLLSWPALLPRRIPPIVTHGSAGETLVARMGRYRRQFQYILFRARFHLREGIPSISASISFGRQKKASSQ